MGTQAQIAANPRNGKKGGVKTEEGKMKSRLNARKHGIFANALTRDDEGQVAAIHGKLLAELNPGSVVEEILVDKMTVLRLERCARMEAVWLEQAPTPFDECPVTDQRDWHELTRQERKQRDASAGFGLSGSGKGTFNFLPSGEGRAPARRLQGIYAKSQTSPFPSRVVAAKAMTWTRTGACLALGCLHEVGSCGRAQAAFGLAITIGRKNTCGSCPEGGAGQWCNGTCFSNQFGFSSSAGS